ncbi:MAG TPA: CHAT domain-containing protein [Kamptonema sp.]|nr:CHAT domain-containing protein [Kamptonema sp.]
MLVPIPAPVQTTATQIAIAPSESTPQPSIPNLGNNQEGKINPVENPTSLPRNQVSSVDSSITSQSPNANTNIQSSAENSASLPNSPEPSSTAITRPINTDSGSSFSNTTLGYGGKIDGAFQGNDIGRMVWNIEQMRNSEFENYLGIKSTLSERENGIYGIQNALKSLSVVPGKPSAIIYIVVRNEQLELILVPPEGEPIRKSLPEARREVLLPVVKEFREEITNPRKRGSTNYRRSAQQLYQWMIAPLEGDLKRLKLKILLFSLDPGLRSIPIAALMDGERFLIDKYSFSLIPSFSLTDTNYSSLADAQLLAMGASEFKEYKSLPAVPAELHNLTTEWGGSPFLNSTFTLENLNLQRNARRFRMIHLATHAEFLPGIRSNSYILFWNGKLHLDQMNAVGWKKPQVDLLVLSACKTALGDREAELGFGGLAVQAGVKSALASLWYVEDEGTLSLMTEFYQQLKVFSTKAESLQQAQVSMLRGNVRIENGNLVSDGMVFPLPPQLRRSGSVNFTHPFYWSGFTMVGSPW